MVPTPTSRSWMRLPAALASLALPICAACATDTPSIARDAAASATAGGSSGSGSGGATAETGASTGGVETFDASSAAACHADAGAGQCDLCLETLCCDPFTACLRDPTCRKAYATYRSCITPDQMDQPKCLSTFVRTGGSDAGDHQDLYKCILIDKPGCAVCGGVSVL